MALQEVPPIAPLPEAPPEWLENIHGQYRLLFRSRWTSSDFDSDVFNFLTATAGNPDKDRYSAAASGRFQSDLDGNTSSEGFSTFDSVSDSYKKAATAQLHYAYLDITNPWPGVRARAGRQILDELPEALPIDGGRFLFEPSEKVSVGVFGGLPVNYFESSTSGDYTYGGWIETRPWTRGRARLEYLHLEDENTFGLFRDDLIGLSVEHGEGDWLFGGRATWLESESRDILLRGSLTDPAAGLTLDVRMYYLFEQQQAHSPRARRVRRVPGSGGALLPALGRGVEGAVGDLRPRRDDHGSPAGKRGRRSRLQPRVHALEFTARSSKWPTRDLSVSLTGDFWQTQADDFWTAGGAVTWQVAEMVKAVISSSYSLYSIDLLTGEERDRVRSLTVSVRWKATSVFTVDTRFTAEENDIDTFRIFDIGGRYAF